MDDFTRKFDFVVDQDAEIHRIMLTVYQALEEKGYIKRDSCNFGRKPVSWGGA